MPPLSGISVLVTRPIHQAGKLMEILAGLGGHAVPFPVIEIGDILDDTHLKSIIGHLSEYDLAVFVSPNAVQKAMERIGKLPEGMLAAIGNATLSALQACGARHVLVPEARYDSEGLLELPEMQAVEGKQIVIFRGEGGRELLGEALSSRGASVDYAECYRRLIPVAQTPPGEEDIQAVTATSGESVRNLCEMLGWIRNKPIFVPHGRIGKIAQDLGFHRVVVTESGDEGLAEGLVKWFEFGESAHG